MSDRRHTFGVSVGEAGRAARYLVVVEQVSETLKQTRHDAGIEFKDFILGFRQSTFLCTTLKCIEKFRIPFIKSGIPASNLGSSEARNPAKFAACDG